MHRVERAQREPLSDVACGSRKCGMQLDDPEEVRELLTRYFDASRETIDRYGGLVEKFIGDAVMAVWGTPTAHEDDAERAVRAALDLLEVVEALGDETGAELRARAAVLTGEAAATVGAVSQGVVAGDLVNTASRLQSAADPGTLLVGDITYRSANKAIAFEPLGDVAVKGRDEPVVAYRALRVVGERGGAGRSESIEPPFVGRSEELRSLMAHVLPDEEATSDAVEEARGILADIGAVTLLAKLDRAPTASVPAASTTTE